MEWAISNLFTFGRLNAAALLNQRSFQHSQIAPAGRCEVTLHSTHMAQQTKGRGRKFLRRIEDAERSGASKLDISGIRFKTIPESLSRLSNLQSPRPLW